MRSRTERDGIEPNPEYQRIAMAYFTARSGRIAAAENPQRRIGRLSLSGNPRFQEWLKRPEVQEHMATFRKPMGVEHIVAGWIERKLA